MINYKRISLLFGIMLILIVLVSLYCGVIIWELLIFWLLAVLLVYFLGIILICGNFYTTVICKAKTKDKVLSLSFDDGPDEHITPQVLDILKENNISACFFIVGEKAEKNPELIKRIHAEGHLIGNHSYRHGFWFDMKCKSGMIKEMQNTDQVIKKIIAKDLNLFRPPYGITNPPLARAIKKQDYKVIGWNIRSFDKSNKSVERIVKCVSRKFKAGSIILLHDDNKNIVEILKGIIDEAQKKSFTFAPLDKMLNINAYKND